MSDVVLGRLIEMPQNRDAIHVAVIPMKAFEALKPGQRVGVVSEGVAGPCDVVRGIVDPYLEHDVPKDATFWMCLLPNTVTGMRHQWSHPAFSESDVDISEPWLRAYARRVNSYDTPEEAFQRLLKGLRTGELLFRGSDLHGLYDLEDADDLRRHGEAYLGIAIDWGRFEFSCSC